MSGVKTGKKMAENLLFQIKILQGICRRFKSPDEREGRASRDLENGEKLKHKLQSRCKHDFFKGILKVFYGKSD